MWIWVVFCVLPAAYAASKVGPHYGSLASWATLVVVLATQTALLMWVVDRVTRRLGLAGQADATAPSDSLDDEPVDGPMTRLMCRFDTERMPDSSNWF